MSMPGHARQEHAAHRRAAHREGTRAQSLLSVGLRRCRFLLHWLFYALRHGTTKHATWACHHKGLTW